MCASRTAGRTNADGPIPARKPEAPCCLCIIHGALAVSSRDCLSPCNPILRLHRSPEGIQVHCHTTSQGKRGRGRGTVSSSAEVEVCRGWICIDQIKALVTANQSQFTSVMRHLCLKRAGNSPQAPLYFILTYSVFLKPRQCLILVVFIASLLLNFLHNCNPFVLDMNETVRLVEKYAVTFLTRSV